MPDQNSTYLDANQGIANIEPSADTVVNNTVDEENELQKLEKCLQSGKKYREIYDKDWKKYEEYYNGNQWYGRKRPSYRASPSANVLRSGIQTVLPILTDTQPSIDAIPTDPSDIDFAEMASKAVRAWWDKDGMPIKMVEVLEDSLKYGIGVLKVIWDNEAENGTGEIAAKVISPWNFWVPDGTVDINSSCQWTLEKYPCTVGEAKRKYPDKAKLIKATGKRASTDGSSTANTEVTLVSPVDKDMWTTQMLSNSSSTDDNEVVWIYELWVDDLATEEVDGENGEKVQKRKWPNGKVVQAILDSKIILSVSDNPYKDKMKHYVRFINCVRNRQFYGVGEIEPYIPTQDLINRSLSVIYDYIATIVNPVWIVDNDSGVDVNKITNIIGQVIQKNPRSEVRRDQPPNLPPSVFNFYQMMRDLYDTQSGVHDITQGRKPAGITAAQAIDTLQEAAQTRIRLKERNMQHSLTQLGRLVIALMLQFYHNPRMVRLTGSDKWPEYFEWFVEDTGDGNYKYNKRSYSYDQQSNQYRPNRNWEQSQKPSKGIFDIEVVAGTNLPWMKSQRSGLALQLAQAGMIDQKAVLDALEWKGKEEIINRMEQKKNQDMQAQAAAAANKPGQPQPGQ